MTSELLHRLNTCHLAAIYYHSMAMGKLPAVTKLPAGYALGAYRAAVCH